MTKVAEVKGKVALTLDGQTIELPIIEGSEQEKALDISKLRSATPYITLDVGYKNTGSCTSAITYLDGDNGILRYRGYPIEQLAERASFIEVAYLLIFGELPNKAELDTFNKNIKDNQFVPEELKMILHAFPRTAHPMGMLSSMICTLSAYHPESLDPHRPDHMKRLTMYRLLGKLPTIAAWVHRRRMGMPLNYPKRGLDYCSNFMAMMNQMPNDEYEVDPVIVDALNTLLILHADHEQNCSTSTVRIVGSSNANLYSAIASGINALWGPLHGGANQEVIEMLEEIKADGGDVQKYVLKAKDKNDNFRLMGFGHRVYKNFDPRARIIKKACDSILAKLGIHDPVLDIAKQLEEAALSDDYFKERKLYPNVDFYSGIIYRALGIPTEMFTVMFALGRLPGWIAQWKEMIENGEPIGRPRQIYTGYTERQFVALDQR